MTLARQPLRHAFTAGTVLALAVGGWSLPLVAQQAYDIALRDGLLSIRANGAPVTELAAALAAETGISFVVTGDAGTPITTEIVEEPFVKAVAKLSPNHLLVKDGKGADATVVEVVLMLDDSAAGVSGGGDGFLPSGAPADEIVGEELPQEAGFEGQDGFDETGFDQTGFDQTGFDEQGMPLDGSVDPGAQEGLVSPDDGLAPAEEPPLSQ